MTRELCSEGWAVDKLRIINQIKPKYRKWTPKVTRTIDKDKCNRSVIDPYDYEPLQCRLKSPLAGCAVGEQPVEVTLFVRSGSSVVGCMSAIGQGKYELETHQ